MALKSFLTNLGNGISNAAANAVSSIKSKLEGIVGSATASFTGLWDGGFAGFSADAETNIKEGLNKYVETCESCIALFNSENRFGDALKGDVLTAAVDYSNAIKELLQAYITTMRQNIDDMSKAFEAYKEQTSDLATQINSDAESIRQQAAQIRLD